MGYISACNLTAALCLSACGLLSMSSARADQPFSASPLGLQRVLVLPIEIPTGVGCPDASAPCPYSQAKYDQLIGPPRHSPQEWEGLLNSVATTWWQRASYGQSQFQFTVLRNPQTADGWWPPPHTWQQYQNNNSNWYQSKQPATYPLVPDVTASVVQSLCGNPLLAFVCQTLPQYNRLIVLLNVHAFGAQTLGNDYPFTIATGTSLGNLVVSATATNEDSTDQSGIAGLLHELGHQAGELSHYGDCSGYINFSSFNSVIPAGAVECISGWDIMGTSPSFSDFSGYSKVSRGLIDPASTATFDLIDGGPFVQSFTLNPVELAPTADHPNVLRLSIGDPSWPQFLGYFVECRLAIGNDALDAFPGLSGIGNSIPDAGVLITSVHEFSADAGVPAHHVERPLTPVDALNHATLKPGQVFTDSMVGLNVRFDSYVQTPGGGTQCSVSVAHDRLLPVLARRYIRFAGSLPPDSRVKLGRDAASISADIAYNARLRATPQVGSPLPVEAPWAGHGNPMSIRVHNRSLGEITSVKLGITVHQPALITDDCAMSGMNVSSHPGQANELAHGLTDVQSGVLFANLPLIRAGASAVATVPWPAASDESVSIEAIATGPANQIRTDSREAFQFHSPQDAGEGLTSTLRLAASPMCAKAQTYAVAPAVAPVGWQVEVNPTSITLNPGEGADVSVHVTPPQGAASGEFVEIPVTVRVPMQMLPNSANIDSASFPTMIPGVHLMPVGTLTVLARVTSGPGQVRLACANRDDEHDLSADRDRGEQHCSDDRLHVAGDVKPAADDSSVTIEYRGPRGQVVSHVVYTDSNGHYADSLGDTDDGGNGHGDSKLIARTDDDLAGEWLVQSRWSGGRYNDPTESNAVTLHVSARHEH